MEKRRLRVTDGGYAVPLGNNYFLMKGKTHEQGGIGLSDKIEVENNEIVKVNKDSAKVYSAQPMIAGYSPAELILRGASPRKVFSIQQSLNGNNNDGYGKEGTDFNILKNIGKLVKKIFNKSNDASGIDVNSIVIDPEELKIKQAYAESGFRSDVKSGAGASGIFQIMPDVLKDYNTANNTSFTVDDLSNDSINTVVRDFKFNKTLNSEWVNKNNPSDAVRYAKALVGYNFGNMNTLRRLERAKKDGVDIYNTLDWLSTKYLPEESVNYTKYLLGIGSDGMHRNDAAYAASKKLNKDKVEKIKQYKYGGIMKGNNNNKEFHLVKDTFNAMFPSTGERKKFLTGGQMLGINAGLQAFNALAQGIAGSVNASNIEKMYNNMKRKSTYVPIARRHINTNYDVSPMLDANRDAEFTLAKNAMANTSSSKVAREQLKQARLARLSGDTTAYSTKINEENKLKAAETELQKQYDMYDNQNLTKDISDSNDFEMQKQLGITNAKTSAANTWGQSIGTMISGIGNSLLQHTVGNYDLLKSQNPAAVAQGMENLYGHAFKFDENNNTYILKDAYKNNPKYQQILDLYNNYMKYAAANPVSTSTKTANS